MMTMTMRAFIATATNHFPSLVNDGKHYCVLIALMRIALMYSRELTVSFVWFAIEDEKMYVILSITLSFIYFLLSQSVQ